MEKKKYPIYRQDEGAMPDGLYIGLFHGFENEEARSEKGDWGEDGALIGPIKWFHTTYASHFRFSFMDGADFKKYGFENDGDNDLIVEGGCVHFDNMEYGDWTVFYIKNGRPIGEDKNMERDRCDNCGRVKKNFMHNCDSSTYNEVYGCPVCDDKCAFCDNNAEPVMRFRNFYRHEECGTEWDDTWDSMCNDKCPECGAEIEPYNSEELEPED